MSVASPYFLKIDSDFAIDGALSPEGLENLTANYRSVLYLCTDSSGDRSVDAGFELLSTRFPDSLHIPFDSTNECFSSTYPQSLKLRHECLKSYLAFENALDTLSRPVAIICKSSRRAGAVLSAYKGNKESMSFSEIVAYGSEQGLSYLQSEGMSAWVRCVLEVGKADVVMNPSKTILFRQPKKI